MKIIIKGKFTVETDSKMMKGFKQPVELLELEILPINPVIVNRIKSWEVKKMNDIQKIKFELVDEGHINIFAVFPSPSDLEEKKVLIGDIFSQAKDSDSLQSFSGKNSIQICGFDQMKGLWSCGRFNYSQDCCLIWNDIESFLKKKDLN